MYAVCFSECSFYQNQPSRSCFMTCAARYFCGYTDYLPTQIGDARSGWPVHRQQCGLVKESSEGDPESTVRNCFWKCTAEYMENPKSSSGGRLADTKNGCTTDEPFSKPSCWPQEWSHTSGSYNPMTGRHTTMECMGSICSQKEWQLNAELYHTESTASATSFQVS